MPLENIKTIDVFNGLDESALESIDQQILWGDIPNSYSILSHLEESTEVYFLAKGSVRATTYSFSGKEIAYQDLRQGKIFGEISFIDGESRTTNVVALEDCVIGRIKAVDFWKVLEQHPSVVKQFLKRLAAMVRFLCGRVYEYGALGVNDRIRAEILKHARENVSKSNQAVIENMPTHEEIANRVSTHREAVTKEFSALYKQGFIKKDGKKILVPDIEKLEELIGEII